MGREADQGGGRGERDASCKNISMQSSCWCGKDCRYLSTAAAAFQIDTAMSHTRTHTRVLAQRHHTSNISHSLHCLGQNRGKEKNYYLRVSSCRRASYIQILIHVALSVAAEGLVGVVELGMRQGCTHREGGRGPYESVRSILFEYLLDLERGKRKRKPGSYVDGQSLN